MKSGADAGREPLRPADALCSQQSPGLGDPAWEDDSEGVRNHADLCGLYNVICRDIFLLLKTRSSEEFWKCLKNKRRKPEQPVCALATGPFPPTILKNCKPVDLSKEPFNYMMAPISFFLCFEFDENASAFRCFHLKDGLSINCCTFVSAFSPRTFPQCQKHKV